MKNNPLSVLNYGAYKLTKQNLRALYFWKEEETGDRRRGGQRSTEERKTLGQRRKETGDKEDEEA